MGIMLLPMYANCATIGDWAKEKGYWIPYTDTPKAGDLPLFDFSGGHSYRQHIGIVESVGTSTITTIEGNTGTGNNANGGMVMERQRSKTDIVGYIRPPYNSTETAAKLIEIAKAQIGVKESPANSNNVKYNTWFYGKAVSGSAYAWCVVFVLWCFAVLAGRITDTATATVKKTACTVTGYVLKNGSTGEGVKTLQCALNGRGYSCGTADGEYGVKTVAAVKKYQAANGLTADGECGALTWAKLLAI